MAELIDLTGMKFGMLTVLEKDDEMKRSNTFWRCLCECGNICSAESIRLRKGLTINCGCKKDRKVKKNENMIGRKIGKLTVIRQASKEESKYSGNNWVCTCECGNEIIASTGILSQQRRKSCGCLLIKKNEFLEGKEFVIGILSVGTHFIIDKVDLEKVKEYCWYKNSENYVRSSSNGNTNTIGLHNLIMNPPEGYFVDHIDRNPLNNRRENLRICNKNENSFNRGIRSDSSSGVKGVTYIQVSQKWSAYIGAYGEVINLGLFVNKEDAIRARKEAEVKYHGEFRHSYIDDITKSNNSNENTTEDDTY
jgi:hypothetical protein